jgi:DNA-directed RNA polymerase specialized sigma24 family protein
MTKTPSHSQSEASPRAGFGRQREKTDVFPATASTWLAERLDEGAEGLASARSHVMDVYRFPLMVYIRGSSFRRLGEPDDLVAGFFADRLGRDDFLHQWIDSGRPLRRWLLVALKYFLLEQARSGKRSRMGSLGGEDWVASTSGDENPGVAFNRETGKRLVAEAMRRTAEALEQEGMEAHWQIFVQHHVEGYAYEDICGAHGVDPRRAAVMARTAARRFRQALRDVVAWPGATETQVDAELQAIVEDVIR